MTSSTITIRINDQLKTRLEKLAGATHRSKSFLATAAINEYVKTQEWQIKEIKRGLAEAEAHQLIEHENIVNHWKHKRAHSMDKRR
jgi:RHH-type rel operon transcriptional repressor/antitoxin RelB